MNDVAGDEMEQLATMYRGHNGFLNAHSMKQAWASGGDDDSQIPTPPPAAVYPRPECPVHRPAERSYVSVHSAASPVSAPSRCHYGMPDITAFSQLMHQRRQISTESDNYKVISDLNNMRSLQQQHQVPIPQITKNYLLFF